jgi:hypothetical protein
MTKKTFDQRAAEFQEQADAYRLIAQAITAVNATPPFDAASTITEVVEMLPGIRSVPTLAMILGVSRGAIKGWMAGQSIRADDANKLVRLHAFLAARRREQVS